MNSEKVVKAAGNYSVLLIMAISVVGLATNKTASGQSPILTKPKAPQSHEISVNYMRLFGARQVPFIMRAIGHFSEEPCIDVKCQERIQNAPDYSTWQTKHAIESFWRSWEYRDAKPLNTKLWERYSTLEQGERLFLLSLMNDQKAWDFYALRGGVEWFTSASLEWTMAGEDRLTKVDTRLIHRVCSSIPGLVGNAESLLWRGAEQWLNGDVVDKKWKAAVGTINHFARQYLAAKSHEVGFLYLIIENTSDVRLSNIDLTYKKYIADKYLEEMYEPKLCVGGDCPLTGYSAPDPNYDLSKFPSAESVERFFRNWQSFSTLRLPYLKRGDSVLWLLAIYFKNDEGYPKRYISNVIKPEKIVYSVPTSSALLTLEIREPLREKAAKIKIPFGWYLQ